MIKKKQLIPCIIAAVIIVFALTNIIKIDRQYHFRFETDVFLEECSNDDAKILKTMPFIRRLEIRNCTADNIDFVEKKPFLTELSILKYNGDWAPLRECKNLKSFSVTNSTFDDLTYFSEMDHLNKLNFAVFSNDVKIESADGLDDIGSLKTLTLNGLDSKNLIINNYFPTLETLTVQYSDIKSISLDIEGLQCISLKNNCDLEECIFSENCFDLKEITISDCPNIKLDADEMLKLPKLSRISISEGILTKVQLERINSAGIEVDILSGAS